MVLDKTILDYPILKMTASKDDVFMVLNAIRKKKWLEGCSFFFLSSHGICVKKKSFNLVSDYVIICLSNQSRQGVAEKLAV